MPDSPLGTGVTVVNKIKKTSCLHGVNIPLVKLD